MKTILTILFIAVIGTVNAQVKTTVDSKYATVTSEIKTDSKGNTDKVVVIQYGEGSEVKKVGSGNAHNFKSLVSAMNYLAKQGYVFKNSESEAWNSSYATFIHTYYIMELQDRKPLK